MLKDSERAYQKNMVTTLNFIIHNNLNQTEIWRLKMEKKFSFFKGDSVEGIIFFKRLTGKNLN